MTDLTWILINFTLVSLSIREERSNTRKKESQEDSDQLSLSDSSVLESNEKEESEERNRRDIGLTNSKVGYLLLPPGYNKLIIPLGNISSTIYCLVSLAIKKVLDVDIANEVGL